MISYQNSRKLILGTVATFLLTLVCIFVLEHDPIAGKIDCSKLPTIGSANAPIQMVIFEDPTCSECKDFHLHVFPLIKDHYIERGLVQCSLVMLSFLDNSPPLAVSSMAVYETNPDLFFPYVDQIFRVGKDAKIEGIDFEKLKGANADGHLSRVLDENDRLGRKMMRREYGTPSVFINGFMTKSNTVGGILTAIDHALQKEES